MRCYFASARAEKTPATNVGASGFDGLKGLVPLLHLRRQRPHPSVDGHELGLKREGAVPGGQKPPIALDTGLMRTVGMIPLGKGVLPLKGSTIVFPREERSPESCAAVGMRLVLVLAWRSRVPS